MNMCVKPALTQLSDPRTTIYIYIYGQAQADLEEQVKEIVRRRGTKKRVSSAVTEADTTQAVKQAKIDSAWMEGKFNAARVRAHTYKGLWRGAGEPAFKGE